MNIFYWIFIIDCILLGYGYLIGSYAIEKEQQDTWGDAKTIECKKSKQLSKVWEEKHPILDFFQSFYYEIGRKLEIPGEVYRNIRWFIQRGKRGYSDYDIWGFDYYLIKVISKGIKELQRQVHGVPGNIAEKFKDKNDPDGIDNAMKEWKRILGEIAWTFESAHKVNENDWILINNEKQRNKLTKFYDELNKSQDYFCYIMTKEECKRYREGWKLFQKYFFNLWD